MLVLLVVPVLLAVAVVQRYLAIYAPSNLVIRRVRTSPARLSAAAGLAALAGTLLLTMRGIQLGISAGAPGWPNLVVLVLAWDAIKIAALACQVGVRVLLPGLGRRESSDAVARLSNRLAG